MTAARARRPRGRRQPAAAVRTAAGAGATYERLRRVLVGASLAFAACGVAVALGGGSALPGGLADALTRRFLPRGPTPEALVLRDFLLAPLGAATAAWWTVMAALFHQPLRRRERWAHRTAVAALVLWLALDAGAAVWRRAWFEILWVDLAPLVLVGLPLWRMRGSVRAG